MSLPDKNAAPDTAPARVVVIEDELTITRAIADRLAAEGWEVTTAPDGPSGVRAVSEVRPDVVVLDVMLPGFDGLEVCRRIQADEPVPVLMLTARDDENRKSTRLNSSHVSISYAVFCLKKKIHYTTLLTPML